MQARGTSSILCFRLSSLGDVVLSTSAAAALHARGQQSDWVTLDAYAGLLEGHPAIGRVWVFSKKDGLVGWIRFVTRIARENSYEEILDLHGSLRTRIARFIFFLLWKTSSPRWRRFPKERWRSWGFYTFKSIWPRGCRPRSQRERYSRVAGGDGSDRPDLSHLLRGWHPAEREGICVMPSAKGVGKTWAADRWVALLSDPALVGSRVTVLGTPQDRESFELLKRLKGAGVSIEMRDALGVSRFVDLARIIAECRVIYSVDTGLAHLAESLGVPSIILYGPTHPDQGFGPWGVGSRAVATSLWCSPCGRDGRYCFRLANRFECQRRISVKAVLDAGNART